jgi:hypothetical protein
MERSKYYLEGRLAFESQGDAAENPYVPGSFQHAEWNAGWLSKKEIWPYGW